MPTKQEISDSRALIIDTFKEFRTELLASYGKVQHIAKGDNSPVTHLDIKLETTLKERLLAEFPDFGFKGEETDEVIGTNGATWYVDPIDGTSSFIHGLPYCSNMAGLVIDGEMVASVVYHFVPDELFTAFKGEGAFKNGVRISVNNTALNDSYVFSDAFSYLNIYKYFAPSQIKFYAPMGATGYLLTRVAQGSTQAACYLKSRIKHHDVIPGALLVLEAGGQAVSFTKEPFNYTSLKFIIGTPDVCRVATSHLPEIMDLISE